MNQKLTNKPFVNIARIITIKWKCVTQSVDPRIKVA